MASKVTTSYAAMEFARQVHKHQTRKYTGQPYFDHLAEVVGIAMSAWWSHCFISPDNYMAVAWLHDSMEDQGISPFQLRAIAMPEIVIEGVQWLSDLETGNRKERKAASRERLSRAPAWVQTIKCADLISNTSSIVKNDPNFARVYLKEKIDLLYVLDKADEQLHAMAYGIAMEGLG